MAASDTALELSRQGGGGIGPALSGRFGGRWSRSNVPDVLLAVAVICWFIGVQRADAGAVDQYGLLGAMPLVYFASFVVLLVSTGVLLVSEQVSGWRLALHLMALVVMIHGTAPLVYAEPRYAWAYKHMGVVNSINARGRLDAGVDLYNNWPGFFAIAAWFGQIAGIGGPLSYAAWAQVFFNLTACLELGFAARALPLTDRERWLALFVFVGGNWVGQDYFAPQAMGFVLSLGVLALVLHWFRDERTTTWIAKIIHRTGESLRERLPRAVAGGAAVGTSDEAVSVDADGPVEWALAGSRIGRLIALLGAYSVLVFTHELSPYVVALQVSALTLIGFVRPRWLVLAMWGVCLAYLMPRFPIINDTFHLTTALTSPFVNIRHAAKQYPPGLPGRQLAASAARALSLSIWLLGSFGVARRLRERRRVLPMMALAFSPLLVLFAQSYGGEALYRAYLFSLPWTACLVASFIKPEPFRAANPAWLLPAVALLATVGLLFPAYFGLDSANEIPAAEVRASTYFYAHAEPGSVLLGTPNFPTRLAGNYQEFVTNPNSTDPNFLDPRMWGQVLGVNDLPVLANKIRAYQAKGATAGYLVLSTSQANAATLFGVIPDGSFSSLEQALLDSPDWTVFYRDPDTVIFRFVGSSGGDA